jgi:hypothetical protein
MPAPCGASTQTGFRLQLFSLLGHCMRRIIIRLLNVAASTVHVHVLYMNFEWVRTEKTTVEACLKTLPQLSTENTD